MIWSAIGRGIYWTLGVIEGAGRLLGAGRKLARSVRENTDDTDPIPLTHREINLREAQIRCASRPMGSAPPPGCPNGVGTASHATLAGVANREKRENDP